MRLPLRSLIVCVVLSWPVSAAAEIRNFVITADGKSCTAGPVFPNQDVGKLTLSVGDAALRLGAWSVQYLRASDGQPLSDSLTGGTQSVTWSLDSKQIRPASKMTLKGKVGQDVVTCINDEVIVISGPDITDLDTQAELWLATLAGRDRLAQLSHEGGQSRTLLTQLPSGRLAAANPASLREDSTLQIAVVIDKKRNWLVDVNVTACPEREPNRILGNFEGIPSFQAAGPEFDVRTVERPLECGAGTLQYALRVTRDTVSGTTVQATWRVRPVYRFAATVAIGYDTGKSNRSYTVTDGKIALAANPTTVGGSNKIGFTWFPVGIDYEDMRWYNHLINPVLLFDLDTPKKGFVVGTSLTPSGGISLTIGGSFRQVPMPKHGAVGDPTTEKTVETQDDWSKEGRGLYFAVSLDTRIFAALKGLIPKGTKK